VLARVVNMRGVNLNHLDFDYDLTWAAFFLNPQGKVLGRFGGRDPESPDKYLTLPGLKHSLRAALDAHRRDPRAKPPAAVKEVRTVEGYPAARKMKANACIHCHQVYDFRREQLRDEGKWTTEEIWVYPPPDNLGLAVEPDRGNRVRSVADGSPAAKAGLRAGDVLRGVNGRPVASFADVQHALHLAAPKGKLAVAWERGGKEHAAALDLPEGWRKSDISWRTSMWGLEPAASVHGPDLSAGEKKELGLGPKRLAFRQGDFVPPAAARAGVRKGDVILGIDGKELEMTMLQFNTWVRLNYKVGDRITFNVLRGGKRLDLPMTLPRKAF
jgi:serine protease Do